MTDTKDPHVRTVSATIDRIEGESATLDADGHAIKVRREWLGADAREGDAVNVTFAMASNSSLASSVQSRLDALTGRKR